jgi:ferredoxin-NADP reductase
METIQTKIIEIISATPTIKHVRLDLLNNQFHYKAGQWINCYADIQGNREIVGYSIASSPNRKGYVDIAVKISENPVSEYIHSTGKIGDTLYIDGGHGEIYYEKGMKTSLVLLAAGIGIVPHMGIIRYIMDTEIDTNILLIYGAKSPDELIYNKELHQYQKTRENFKYIPLVSDDPLNRWNGMKGRINGKLIKHQSPDPEALYYICGPSQMMDIVIHYLKTQGVQDTQLMYEYWW